MTPPAGPRDRIDLFPEWVDAYAEQRERFRALYAALRAVR